MNTGRRYIICEAVYAFETKKLMQAQGKKNYEFDTYYDELLTDVAVFLELNPDEDLNTVENINSCNCSRNHNHGDN